MRAQRGFFASAVQALWYRETIKFLRDRSRVTGALFQPLGFWLLLGLGFKGTFHMPGADSQSYLAYLYPGMIALIALFTAIFSTISVIEERQSGALQAALIAPVPRLALVLGNVLGGTTLSLLQAVLFLAALPLVQHWPGVQGILLVLVTVVLLGVAFTALGFAMAWRSASTRGFHAVMNVVLLPMWFLSGAPFPAAGASPVMRYLIAVNPVTYAVNLLRIGLAGDGPAHGVTAGTPLSMAVTLGFVAAMLAFAVYTINRPLYAND